MPSRLPWGEAQTWPQAPQLSGSVQMSTHWPPQVAPLHVAVHWPATQLVPALQALPHAPQL